MEATDEVAGTFDAEGLVACTEVETDEVYVVGGVGGEEVEETVVWCSWPEDDELLSLEPEASCPRSFDDWP